MYLIIRWFLFALIIMFIAWLLPGITVSSIWSALLAVVIIGFVNIFIKPLLTFITLPVNILTLGLFTFIVNALLFMLAGYITPGVEVANFLSALLGSLLLAIFSAPINRIGDSNF